MGAPLLILNHSSPVPPYEQIGLQIRALIGKGAIEKGLCLYSVELNCHKRHRP